MKRVDFHCHFTGSLSEDFLASRNVNFAKIKPQFGNNWHDNFHLFFSVYETIQNRTKSADPDNQAKLYFDGSRDICLNYIKEGVDEFHLRVGPRLDKTETARRLENTIKGFVSAEKDMGRDMVGYLILTLIHDNSGNFFNTSPESLSNLLLWLETNPTISKRVIGFDFSGPEDGFDQEMLFTLLNILTSYNKTHNNRYEIAVHALEYIDKNNLSQQFEYAEKLLKYPITRISHGTLLWLDPALIDPDNAERIRSKQEIILKEMAKKSIHLEICPSANRLLSPLRTERDIPLDELRSLGLKYSINTDNKTLFSTNLRKEWGYFPHDSTNPYKTDIGVL